MGEIGMLRIVTLLIFTLFGGLLMAQSDRKMPNEPGKCYAKCLIEDQYEYGELMVKRIPVYTGDRLHTKQLKEYTLDALNDIGLYETVAVQEVRDTTFKSQFTYKEFRSQTKFMVSEGGFTEWREVVCENDVTIKLIKKLKQALNSKGYTAGSTLLGNQSMDGKVKNALVLYQQENGLPVGQLDKETLESLQIKY